MASRVLVLNERDPRHPAAGGVESHIAQVSRRLAERGYEIALACSSFAGCQERETFDGMDVRRLGSLAAYYPRVAWTCRRETRQGRYDLVVEHLCKVPFCSPLYAATPVLAVSHHLFGRSAFRQVSWPIAAGVVTLEKLIPSVYGSVPFLAVSPSSRDDLVARGVRSEQIGLVYNGVDAPESPGPPIAERPLRIGYFGRLEPYKRIEVVLEAAALLAKRFPALEVLIIGQGSARPALEKTAVELGISERTTFSGFVSDAERDALLGSLRVFVCPSVKEGWGITVVEASGLGVPVVATRAPGLVDAVREGETGMLVSDTPESLFPAAVAEAVARLLEDDALSEQFSRGAVEWARRFTWDAAADTTADAIDAAVSRS